MDSLQFLIEYLNQSPIVVQLVWVFGAFLFIANLLLIIYLKHRRSSLRKIKKSKEEYRNEYETLLITYLYAGEDGEDFSSEQRKIISQLKASIPNKLKRTIIVSTMLRLMNEISGEIAESIQQLYIQVGFLEFALVNLKSKKWHIVAKGIRELTLFQVKEAHDEILTHTNHPKREVRKEVQLYLVNLFHFEGLKYLNSLKTPLSEWDQIQLLETLQRFEDQQLPDITPWLRSKNDSVVIFSLKLAKIYNQFELKEILIELLSHSSEKIRVYTISVLDQLYVTEAKNILKETFDTRSKLEQVTFFKMLENLCDENDELFLLENIHHENFEIKYTAIKLLKKINMNEFNNQKTSSSDSEFIEIIEFVENN